MFKQNLENNRQNSNNEFAQNHFGQQPKQETVIVKKKKRPASFERRFLSNQAKGDNCILEVAMLWNGNVMGIHQYEAKPGLEISIGELSECQYHINMNGQKKVVVASCEADNHWKLRHLPTMTGFVLDGSEKIDFSNPTVETLVTGSVRAKYIFGDVSILIHYADKKEAAAGKVGFLKANRYGALAASLLLHISLFSVILLASDRVDALMVDRIMTNTRFALMYEQEEPVVESYPDNDEIEPVDMDTVADTSDLVRESASDTPIINNAPSNNAPANKAEAVGAAMQAGLLNQATAMNSMLAAVSLQDMQNADWSTFDASLAAQSQGYLLSQTGTPGGGVGLSGRLAGGVGPVGSQAYAGLKKGTNEYKTDLGKINEKTPKVPLQNPDVNGGLDKRLIQKVVKDHTAELRACYERELNKVKGLNGRVLLMWTISPQGAVTKVIKKDSTMNNQNVENCILNSVKYWRFPMAKNGGSTLVEYPFVFTVSK